MKNNNWGNIKEIIGSLIVVFIGFLLIKYSLNFMQIIVLIGGIFAVVHGLSELFSSDKLSFLEDERKIKINKGLKIESFISIVLGLFAIIFNLAFAKGVWVISAYTIGIYLVFEAVVKLRMVFAFRKYEYNSKGGLIEALLDLFFAILLFIAPQKIGESFMKLVGWIIVIAGVIGLVVAIFSMIRNHKIKVAEKANEAEAEPLN
ncbi:MAG: DUF308 domain-containing protein [Sphaerochaetaceae bacterium]|nr:DUF308 domain-containing protein [Sphaerochaetaceae bacterium]